MINLLNRKNLFALFFGLTCLSANSAWAAETPPAATSTPTAVKAELATALLRNTAVFFEQQTQTKFGKNSKKALIFSAIADAFKIANDTTSIINEWNNERFDSSEAVNIIHIIYDSVDAFNKINKLIRKEYTRKKETDVNDKQISKAIEKIHKIVPFVSMIATTARSGSKFFGDYSHKRHLIKLCTAFLTLSRALEFFAQAKINESSKMQFIAIVIATAAIAAFIFDYQRINNKLAAASSTKPSEPRTSPDSAGSGAPHSGSTTRDAARTTPTNPATGAGSGAGGASSSTATETSTDDDSDGKPDASTVAPVGISMSMTAPVPPKRTDEEGQGIMARLGTNLRGINWPSWLGISDPGATKEKIS